MVKDDPVTATGFAIIDNRSAELASWDMPVLKELLLNLRTPNSDMAATGFEELDIEETLSDMRPAKVGLIDDDEVPELEENICQPGDLWQPR